MSWTKAPRSVKLSFMKISIVLLGLLAMAGCQSKPREQALSEPRADVAAVRGEAAPTGAVSGNPILNTVHQGITTMDKAQTAANTSNAQTAQQQRAADNVNP
jgi:hypothetical protein